MNKNLNKMVSIITLGAVLSVPMISNATVDTASNNSTPTPVSTETPTAQYKLADYTIYGKYFAYCYVDNFIHPTKIFVKNYNMLVNFENVNDSMGESSNPQYYVKEGYKFAGWKDCGVENSGKYDECEKLEAIIVKDDDYINNIKTSLDFTFTLDSNDFNSYSNLHNTGLHVVYTDSSSSALLSIECRVEGLDESNKFYKDFHGVSSDSKWSSGTTSRKGLVYSKEIPKDCFIRFDCKKAPIGSYKVTVTTVNNLGKSTTVSKIMNHDDLFYPSSIIEDAYRLGWSQDVVKNPISIDGDEFYYGDKIYIHGLDPKYDEGLANCDWIERDDNGWYMLAQDAVEHSSLDAMNYYEEKTYYDEDNFDAVNQIWYGAVFIRASYVISNDVKIHNISRDGKSCLYGKVPEVKVATNTPVVTKPVDDKPVVTPVATKTPEANNKQGKTFDGSSLVITFFALGLAGLVMKKLTKKSY